MMSSDSNNVPAWYPTASRVTFSCSQSSRALSLSHARSDKLFAAGEYYQTQNGIWDLKLREQAPLYTRSERVLEDLVKFRAQAPLQVFAYRPKTLLSFEHRYHFE